MAGQGVAGHKNEYSTGVRVGNWFEDSLDTTKMAKYTLQERRFQASTETKDKYVLPSRMPQVKTTETLDSTLLSEGVTSSEPTKLFRHEHAEFKNADDRFTTT